MTERLKKITGEWFVYVEDIDMECECGNFTVFNGWVNVDQQIKQAISSERERTAKEIFDEIDRISRDIEMPLIIDCVERQDYVELKSKYFKEVKTE